MPETSTPTPVDVRTLAPRDRHSTIFATLQRLTPNEAMELINDHDPKPLHYQLQSELPGQFTWEYLERGPAAWRVLITRANPHNDGRCCGSCGGH
jgi:uncharacterized protein (DUF2249 family)